MMLVMIWCLCPNLGVTQPWMWMQQRLVFMRDVGDHFGDDMEEDGDCVPTCVFRVLDMDIAKDFSVEVAVVKMKNCHFETSLVFSKKLWTVIYLQTEYVSTKNTEKKTYQQEQFTDSYQKCEEVAQETCYNRPGVAPKREQVPLLFVAPWKP